MYLSTDMWYKKVQDILGLIKREFNSCHRCQARVNREKWASLQSFYTPLLHLSYLMCMRFVVLTYIKRDG